MPMIVVLMSVTVAVIVIVVFTLMIAPVLVLTPVSRYIIAVIPVISHEIDASAAGPVFGTVSSSAAHNPERHANRSALLRLPVPLDNGRVLIDHLWWRITTDVELPIEARLTPLMDTPT